MVQAKYQLVPKFFLSLCCMILTFSSLFAQEYERGVVVGSLQCQSDSSQTFALYIPKSLRDPSAKAIIYFMEPAARGSLPIDLYKDLAEKYEVILVGSNNSRNGPLHLGVEAYDHIREHTLKYLPIGESKVIVSGFSGGGRLSQYLASIYEDIDGVLSVAGPKSKYSADFPGNNGNLKYAAVVGTKDMNYREHRLWDVTLKERGVDGFLNIYSAGHQWAPLEEYEMSLAHLYGLLGLGWNDEYLDRIKEKIDSLMHVDLAEAYRLAKSIEHKTLPLANELPAMVAQLESEKGFKKAINQDLKDLKSEGRKMELYYKAFGEFETSILNPTLLDSSLYTISWWRREIKTLHNTAKKSDGKGNLSARLLDNLNGYLHGLTSKGDELERYDLSLMSTELQLIASKNAPWFQWKKAIYLAQLGRDKEAKATIASLKKDHEVRLKEILELPYWNELKANFSYLFI